MYEGYSTGENLARARTRRRLTQENLAELAGVAVATVKAIETGRRKGRLSTLNALARALGTTTSALLEPDRGAQVVDTPPPDALLAVRKALTPPLGLDPDDGAPMSLAQWRASLGHAERLYDADDYNAALEALPVLIQEARTMRAADPATSYPLAQAYLYAGQTLTQLRQLDLANHALGEAMTVAHERGDELLAAWAVAIQCWTLLLQMRYPEVETLATTTAETIVPRFDDDASPQVATWGWLMFRASSAAVRDARHDEAGEYMRSARTAATRIGDAVADAWMPPPIAGFGETTMAYKEIENAVLIGDHGRALKLAETVPTTGTPPTENNRNRHELDLAAAQIATHRPDAAIERLLAVRDAAPVWLRHQGYARGLITQLVEIRRRAFRDEVGTLADHVGVGL